MMHLPLSTYRLQFTPHFKLGRVNGLVEYLAKLGISDVYASPIFAAAKGSDHGYDIVDMGRINDEFGGEQEFESAIARVHENGMRWLQDIVPNHRAFTGDNARLMDVLENGRLSKYHDYFDILWDHPYENIKGRVLAPFLGDFFGKCLERKEIQIIFVESGFKVRYYDHVFPLCPESYPLILTPRIGELRKRLGNHDRSVVKYLGLVRFFENITQERVADPDFDPTPAIKKLLWELYHENEDVRAHVDANLEEINGTEGQPASFDALHQLLAHQHFRLSYWKVGTEELNYRRFFSINGLISLRVEDPKVFEETHEYTIRLVKEGKVDGLRVDHIDGLYDPAEYLSRLRERLPDCYIVAEKILEEGEALPHWPIQGTTGYDFLDVLNGIYINSANADEMENDYVQFSGMQESFDEIAIARKRDIIGKHMAGDVDNLALQLKEIANRYRLGMDLTLYSLRRALVEILSQFPIYRTYASETELSDRDQEMLIGIMKACREDAPLMTNEFALIEDFILQRNMESLEEGDRVLVRHLLMRIQQYAGPVMAKGVEDTAFFVYNRLLSLNEVGGNPGKFGYSTEEFHEFNRQRAKDWPHAMNSSTTHDTKWMEDSRARLNVLSELPGLWREATHRWSHLNAGHRRPFGRKGSPSRNDEYLIYQAMIAVMPLEGPQANDFPKRLAEYAIKAVREAKTHTSWLNPNGNYETGIHEFISAILDEEKSSPFLEDFTKFQRSVASVGMLNSLSALVLKCACPGVPDIYQGTEDWSLGFVDPDNRREPDFAKLSERLNTLPAPDDISAIEGLLQSPGDGRIKMYMLRTLLQLRRENPGIWKSAVYTAISLSGQNPEKAVAFALEGEGNTVLVVAGRFFTSKEMSQTHLPVPLSFGGETRVNLPASLSDREMRHVFTNRSQKLTAELPLGVLLQGFPAAVYITV